MGASDRDRGTMERMGRSVGGLAGRAADAAADVSGSLIMGAADVLGGWWAESAREASRAWGETQERRSRQHFEGSAEASTADASASAEAGYERARPYYRLGHAARQNPDYASSDFDDVEPDLRRAAEAPGATDADRNAAWPDVRGYVQFGYEQGAGGEAAAGQDP